MAKKPDNSFVSPQMLQVRKAKPILDIWALSAKYQRYPDATRMLPGRRKSDGVAKAGGSTRLSAVRHHQLRPQLDVRS
jgi:hypothetical protein